MKMMIFALMSLIAIPVFFTDAIAQEKLSTNYQLVGFWDGEQLRQSTAPGPYCECDRDQNVMDCPTDEFESKSYVGEICYDEFISGNSTYANIFQANRFHR
jgi:hypothetical protein